MSTLALQFLKRFVHDKGLEDEIKKFAQERIEFWKKQETVHNESNSDIIFAYTILTKGYEE